VEGSGWPTDAWRIQPAVDDSYTGANSNRGYIELAFGFLGTYQGIGLSGLGNTTPDFVVNQFGNTGIGTINPGTKLDVNGGIYWGGQAGFLSSEPNGAIEIGPSSSNSAFPYIDWHYGTGSAQDYNVRLQNFANNRFDICTSSNGLVFTVNGGSVGIGTVNPTAKLEVAGNILSSSTLGIGYKTGAGATVTQSNSKSTGVTINAACGTITMSSAALAAASIVSFTVTNSSVAATDCIFTQHDSGGTLGAYTVTANSSAAGSFNISVRNNTTGSLSEAIVIRFAVIKAVTN